ncbi:CUN050 hypothetical protein [Culex nigripalpus nucleopolyhedrovirus]|uniref:Uncharacterized protein n=2 Tax=Deltabaculovirus TaxID=558019 RepID=Q77GU2_NPVCO|nr:CUN050 hypothetical protein [Culex nigripalpus nucleopolyhedrovirus]AAK13269.1 unknown [Culex nigripalpus nucleopolyhedrovirus]AAK94128.1 CUN050 hypothetical protein [Culex nigripalpus nucleopolyhedrovirus]
MNADCFCPPGPCYHALFSHCGGICQSCGTHYEDLDEFVRCMRGQTTHKPNPIAITMGLCEYCPRRHPVGVSCQGYPACEKCSLSHAPLPQCPHRLSLYFFLFKKNNKK